MQKLLARLADRRLQHVLIIGFALTAAATIATGSLITFRIINNYLKDAQDSRVGRDMDLAEAFYNTKLHDISSTAGRIASARNVRHRLPMANQGNSEALQVIDEAIENEILNLPFGTQRFFLVTNALGDSIAGKVAANGRSGDVSQGINWSELPIVNHVITQGSAQSATEIIPAELLASVGLQDQARIPLIDTPKAAPEPYDPREGTAGLVLVGVAPIISEEGEHLGAVLVGHLFNNDFTLVDRVKAVAGVDTVTIFFGDLRISTNVPLEVAGNRAIGTRVSQEVYDTVLVRGKEFTGEAFVVNQDYITRYRPLRDHQGQVVGILYVGAEKASFQRLLDSFQREVYLIAGATILLAILIAIPVAWSISRPLTHLAEATRKVAQGDWSVRVPLNGFREMRTLARSFNIMVETLTETQEQLLQKEKLASVGQLAAGVAHEINNPLGSVLLYADILCKETPEENEQQRKDLRMIIREATRCKTIVNDLLNFSRQNEVLAQDTDLNAMIRTLAEEQSKLELYRNVNIETDLDLNLNTIQADPLQLHQVFTNLMNNAAEAMPDGGTLILRTRSDPEAGFVTVEVEDDGIGIPKENMKRIFTPFFTTKPIGKGTGLGLAIIYGIVKMHRGQLSVQSEDGKGTKFIITLREQLTVPSKPAGGSSTLQ
jgi:two-component system NtrC family sensor kinase